MLVGRYKGRSKSSMPHPERKAIDENFYYSNTLPPLIKLEKLIWVYLNFYDVSERYVTILKFECGLGLFEKPS